MRSISIGFFIVAAAHILSGHAEPANNCLLVGTLTGLVSILLP